MDVWNGIERIPDAAGPVCATIGNYDGVHLGHASILRAVVDRARREEATSLLVTFEPHPTHVVAPARAPRLLQTRDQKLRALESTGLDAVLVVPFTPELARLSGVEFLDAVFGAALELRSIHVGGNFRFGRNRSGDVTLLRSAGALRSFDVVEVEAVMVDGEVVSSSAIRKRLKDGGDVDGAAAMLGRPFALAGEVVRGDGRGRRLRYPTANLACGEALIPARGVYVTETAVEAAVHPSITNVGVRPTFDGERPTVETHLIDFEGDLYHRRLEVHFLARIRDEMRFDGPAALSDQIGRDLAAAHAFFENGALGA